MTVLIISLYLFISSFCEGWEDGYGDGYCYQQEFCNPPAFTPNCPWPKPTETTYKDGYGRGFIKGREDNE